MTLFLHKIQVTEDAEDFWVVSCRLNGSTPLSIKETYSFPLSNTDAEMEASVTADLTAKGYANLTPVSWE